MQEDLLEQANAIGKNTLLENFEISFIEVGKDYLIAQMPVTEKNCLSRNGGEYGLGTLGQSRQTIGLRYRYHNESHPPCSSGENSFCQGYSNP